MSDAEEEVDLWAAQESQSANIDPSETSDSRSQTHAAEKQLNSHCDVFCPKSLSLQKFEFVDC